MDPRVTSIRTSWSPQLIVSAAEVSSADLERLAETATEEDFLIISSNVARALDSLCNLRRGAGDEAVIETLDTMSKDALRLLLSTAVGELDQLDWAADDPLRVVL